ncbi:MAG: SLOG family protein [Oscillospiraceae bacterium]|nr:SLOG family protein [Oscillospiraceae bacterium]
MDRSLCCCFSGHRPAKLPWGYDENDARCLRVKAELEARLEGVYEAGYRHFLCGMAAGCDMLFAEAVLALRRRHPEVTLEAAIPCDGQADAWSAGQRRRYEALVADCDEVRFVQHAYTPGCMQRRNRYMVDRSSLLLACYDGQPGGTMNTILYARRQGCRVILIEL